MVAQELLRRQRELDPKQDLSHYSGEWVILQKGRVVDHGVDLESLLERHPRTERDALIRVSDRTNLTV